MEFQGEEANLKTVWGRKGPGTSEVLKDSFGLREIQLKVRLKTESGSFKLWQEF